jgi:SAM-dependent methyltransferase
MKKVRHYYDYKDYIKFQSQKTLNPEKREKWLGEEWNLKIEGFKREFSKLSDFLTTDKKVLCIGARTGQEVVALKDMGVVDVTGIDIVPHEPHVIEGDMHNLDFESNTFDLVYTNVIDHSINPEKMISEIERVLKIDGIAYIQCQLGIDQDEYTEFIVDNPIHDIVSLFNQSFCVVCQPMDRNFAGMNFELVFSKHEILSKIYEKYGNIQSISVPEEYLKIWEEVNLETQNKKLDESKILSEKIRSDILDGLSKRGYYLTRFAEAFECKRIAEVGTAEGWQYYTFSKFISDLDADSTTVLSCDPRDVRNKEYNEKYKNDNRFVFIKGTSKEMSSHAENIDLFYIDGMHDKNSVIQDVVNLENCQASDKKSVWIFDDFDERFGCFQDILTLCQASKMFKVYSVGQTASGKPTHQAIVVSQFRTQ